MIRTLQRLSFFLMLVASQIGLAREPVLSVETQNAVKNIFGTKRLTWTDPERVRIDNLHHLNGGEPFIEGGVVVFRFLTMKSAKAAHVFVDGNKDPLVASVSIGPSIARTHIKMFAQADDDCGGRYKLVVIHEVNEALFASSTPFRTHVADCDSE